MGLWCLLSPKETPRWTSCTAGALVSAGVCHMALQKIPENSPWPHALPCNENSCYTFDDRWILEKKQNGRAQGYWLLVCKNHESSWITLDRISSHLPPRIAIQGKEDLGCAGDRRCDLWCQNRHICRWDHPTFQPEGCLLWSTLAAVDYLRVQHFVYACPTAGHPVPNFRGSLGRTLPDVLQEL